MKVKHVLMITAVMLAMLAMPVAADTVVTHSVTESYEVSIPESLTVGTAGNIGISGLIDANTQVKISVNSANSWNLSNNNDNLGYSLKKEDQSAVDYNAVLTVVAGSTDEVDVTATLNEGVSPKYRGDYTDVLTFTVTQEADSTTHNGYDLIRSYEELSNLITNGGNGLLINNIEVDDNVGLEITSNTVIILDLNGYTISGSSDVSNTAYLIKNSGSLTLNGPGYVTFTASNPSKTAEYASNTISNYGTLTINSGVIVTGEDDGNASYAVDHYDGKFILNGGTLLDKGTTLRIASFSGVPEFVMEDGLIKGKVAGIVQIQNNNNPAIKVNISDGTMQTLIDSEDSHLFYTHAMGVNDRPTSNTEIIITGGNFLGGVVSIGTGNNYYDTPNLKISGGSFDYDVLKWTSNGAEVVYPQPQNP